MVRTTITGTAGKDRMDVRNGSNDVFGLGGDDVIRLLSSGDTAGNNFVDAGIGKDGVVNNFEGGNEILLGTGDDTYVGLGFGLGGVGDVVRGGTGKDLFVVQTLHSSYFGDNDDDTFVSVGFRNTFNGGSGSDVVSYEARADDSVAGRTGVEVRLDQGKAFTGNSTFETLISIENVLGSARGDIIVGNGGDNQLEGLGGDDLILGGVGKDTLRGGIGADELQGGSGNDELHGDSDVDRLFGEVGDDRLFGESGNDVLSGDSGNDRLEGGTGNDTLLGGIGNDTLLGGAGKDRMTGGSGRDIFDFNSAAEVSEAPVASKRDVITDFVRGSDCIDFSTIDANSTVSGNQAFTLRAGEQTGFTGAAGQLFWDQIGSGTTARTLLSGDINGDAVADFQLEFTGHISFATSDFML